MGGFRCQKITNLEQLPNGWIDCHQIWHTCADSSGNGHRLQIISPSITQGAFWAVLGGQKFKIWNNYQTGGLIGTTFGTHLRIHLGMDIRLKQLAPLYPMGHWAGGVIWGQKFKNLE